MSTLSISHSLYNNGTVAEKRCNFSFDIHFFFTWKFHTVNGFQLKFRSFVALDYIIFCRITYWTPVLVYVKYAFLNRNWKIFKYGKVAEAIAY